MISDPIDYGWGKFAQCRVCGNVADFPSESTKEERQAVQQSGWRCERHARRNPCVIEGCKRSTAATASGELSVDDWLCPEHWRRFVPPRSATRRAYHRFFRIANKTDWTPELRRRFHRFWDGLVKRARRQSVEGRLDMTEINQMFGWGE